jgi:DNA-binding Xre family transcriptional regulator
MSCLTPDERSTFLMSTPHEDLWRLNVKLKSRRLLNDYLRHMGWSQRRLAREAGLKHAIVNHLCNGERSTCRAATARAIEEALSCPPGLLFEVVVSAVSPSNGQRQKVPA